MLHKIMVEPLMSHVFVKTSRPRPHLLTLPAQGGVASGVREDGSVVSVEVYELG